MTETLTYSDTIQRVGHTIIDGVKVVQHTCVLPLSNPEAMRVSMTKLNSELYKEHRDVCRADFAAFEDAAFQLQADCIANKTPTFEGAEDT